MFWKFSKSTLIPCIQYHNDTFSDTLREWKPFSLIMFFSPTMFVKQVMLDRITPVMIGWHHFPHHFLILSSINGIQSTSWWHHFWIHGPLSILWDSGGSTSLHVYHLNTFESLLMWYYHMSFTFYFTSYLSLLYNKNESNTSRGWIAHPHLKIYILN